jgi:hypothetical protein
VSATREQYAKSTAIKTSIIAALRDNVGEEYTAAEIAQAMTSPLDIDVRQVGSILKVMAAEGLVETRPHRNMHIYRLLEPALTWEPKPYRRTPRVAESKRSKETLAESKKPKETPQAPKAEDYFDFTAWTARLAEPYLPTTVTTDPVAEKVRELPKPRVKVVGEVALPVLSERWTADLCLNIRSVPSFSKLDSPLDDREDKIKLRVIDEGAGYFCVVKMDSVADPGDLDFLPSMIEGLIQLMDGLCPTQTKKVPEGRS